MTAGSAVVPTGTVSQRLFEEACRYIPGGTSRVHYFYEPFPIYARSGSGCRLTDVDGVERLDFVNNMTSLIHGHAHPRILAAISEQMHRGTAWSEPGEEEVRLAKHLAERVPSIERIRFGNSGTENVMMAIKLARAFTGRHKIAKFEGFYHGYYDYIQVSVKSAPTNWGPAESPASVANSGGLSPTVLDEVVTVPFNKPDILEQLLERHGAQIAAFLVDPLASQAGSPIPAAGFLERLTALTRRYGIVLIYDEVVSFRLGYGGAQELYGGTPDLTALGKIIGGGLPVGAVGGREDIMSLLDPTKRAPKVLSGGTFSANPLTMAAGLAAMELYTRAEVERVNALGARMRDRINALFAARGERMCAGGDGSLVRLLLMDEPPLDYRQFVTASGPARRLAAIHAAMLEEGVIITRMGTACISTPMGEGEVDAFVHALERALERVSILTRPSAAGAPERQLKRGLGPLEAITLVVGGTIGASIFLVPSAVAREVGSPGLALFAWLLTGLLALCGALSFAELAGAIPETGGTYQFLKRAYPGTPIAFLFGWMMFFAYAASATAVTTTLAVENAGHFIAKYTTFAPTMSRALTVGIIVIFTTVNCIGVRESGKTQNILTLLKVGGILAIIASCFLLGDGHAGAFTPILPAGRPLAETTGSLGTAMILTVFSYSGWYFITHVAGEVREPEKNLPRAIFVGMGILIALYVLVNAAYLYVLPFDSLKSAPLVAAEAMKAVFGPVGADIISALAFLSAIGAVNAQLLNYPRIPFSLASDGVFFRRLATVHPTRRTPVNAIIVFAVIACTFAVSGTYQDNLTYVGFVGQLFMALTVIGLIVLRRREPDLPRPFRVPLYPLVPLLYVAILTWYLGNLLVNRFTYSMVGIAIVLAGLPFYYYWKYWKQRRPLPVG